MSDLASIIEQINNQLEGEDFARLLNYHPDKIQISGGSLKCFCPVHQERAFRSLIINLKNNTYKCTMKHCACFNGGTLIELWMMLRSLEPVEAALDLAEKLKIQVDVATLQHLSTNYADMAHEALSAGELDKAREALVEALNLDPRNADLHLLSAKIYEAQGQTDQALQERLGVFDQYFDQGNLTCAHSLLKSWLLEMPENLELLARRVELARREEDSAGLAEALMELAEQYELQERLDDAATALDEASRLAPANADLLERLAQLREQKQDRELLDDVLERLADLYAQQGQNLQLQKVLMRRVELNPAALGLRDALAQALAEDGQTQQAVDQWTILTDALTEQGQIEAAIEVQQKILLRTPQDLDQHEKLALLFQDSPMPSRAVALYQQMVDLAQQVGSPAKIGQYYEQACRIQPENLDLLTRRAEWNLSSGHKAEALNDLMQLSEMCLKQKALKKAMAAFEQAIHMAPHDLDKRLQIARSLERFGHSQEAYDHYARLVEELLESERMDSAQAIGQELCRLAPLAERTLELVIRTHLALGQKDEAIEFCRKTAANQAEQKEQVKAEQTLKRAVKIDRTEVGAKSDLARLYESQKKTEQAVALWIEMAQIHRAQNKIEQANQSIREALRLDAENTQARIMLAEGLEAQGRTSEALAIWKGLGLDIAGQQGGDGIKVLKHALELDPNDRNLLGTVARMTFEQEGSDAALEYFQSWTEKLQAAPPAEKLDGYQLAVRQYPNQTQWRRQLAELLRELGQHAQAIDQYEALLTQLRSEKANGKVAEILEILAALCPQDLELRTELADLLVEQNRHNEAIELYQQIADQYVSQGEEKHQLAALCKALNLDDDREDLLEQVACLQEHQGQSKQAFASYQRLCELHRRHSDRSRNIPVLEKLLQYDPQHLEWQAELADLYEIEGDLDKAIEHHLELAHSYQQAGGHNSQVIDLCQKVIGLAPEHEQAHELLVEAWMEAKVYDKAKEMLDQLGDRALAQGRLEEAEKYFKRVQKIDPDDIGSGERLGKLYEARGNNNAAADAFERVLAIYEKLSETARMIGVMQKLKQLRPQDLELRLRLAEALTESSTDRSEAGQEWLSLLENAIETEQNTIVEKVVEQTHEAFKSNWEWRQGLIELLSLADGQWNAIQLWTELAEDACAAREYEVVREAARQGLELQPGALRLRELRIEANRSQSNYKDAAEDLRDLAQLCLDDEQWEKAQAYLNQAIELQPRSAQLLEMLIEAQEKNAQTELVTQNLRRLIELLQQEGQNEQAIEKARQLVRLHPGQPEQQEYLANLLLDAQQIQEALEIWQEMAEELVAQENIEAALTRYAKLLDKIPGNIAIMRRMADLTYEIGGMFQAMSLYDRLMDALLADGDAEATEAEYRRILDLEPGHLQMKERLADFLGQQGRSDEAIGTLLEVVTAYRDEREELGDAVRVLRHLKTIAPDNIGVWEEEAILLERQDKNQEAVQAWRQVAMLHRRLKNPGQVAAALARCADLDHDNPEVQIEAADAHEKLGQTERTTQYLLQAIEIHDRFDQLDKCVGILERAIELNPEQFELVDALARIHERLNQIDQATQVWLKLGSDLEQHQQVEQAKLVYLHLCDQSPEALEPHRRLANLFEAHDERRQAVSELRQLAKLARDMRDEDFGAHYLERLLALDPQDEQSLSELGEVWRDLGCDDQRYENLCRLERIYTNSDRFEQAIATLDDLNQLHPDDPQLIGRSVELLIKTGHGDQAAQRGIELIQIYFDLDQDALAIDVLRRIGAIDPGNVDRQISLARLVHANGRESEALQEFFLAASRQSDTEAFEGCLELCQAGLQLFPDDVRLRDLMGRTLTKLGREGEAIEVQLHLAALYDERGDELKAQRVYESILQDKPDHQGTLEAMVEWALRHDKGNCAVEHLTRLAESHYMAGRLDQAIDAMERIQALDPKRLELKARLAEIYLQAGDEQGARTTWLAASRGLLDAGQTDKAIEVLLRLHELNNQDIESCALLSEAYRMAGRMEDHVSSAVALCDLYLDNQQLNEARALIERLVEAEPENIEAWQKLATIYGLLGQNEPSARVHRQLYQIHQNARRFDQAQQSLEAALELAPDDVQLIRALGENCLSLGLRKEGLDHLSRAAGKMLLAEEHEQVCELAQKILKLDPANHATRLLLAKSYEACSQHTQSISEYTAAAQGFAEAHENLQAIEVLDHLLQLEPQRIEERELYAKVLRREERIEESVQQYLTLLDSLSDQEDPRRAIKYCRQILTDQPDTPQAHVQLCRIYERTEKLRQAFGECEWLADYYQTRNELDRAEDYIRQGLDWFPEELGLRRRLIDLLIQAGQTPQATDQLCQLAIKAEQQSQIKMSVWAMQRACETEQDNLDYRRRLADYLEEDGQAEQSRQVRLELIGLMLNQSQMAKAKELADRVVGSAPEDHTLRIQVAQMFEEAGLPEVSAKQYHDMARQSLAKEDFEQAKNYARQVVALKPRHVGGRETLIEALRAQRENSEAIVEYQKLYELYNEAGEHEAALSTLQSMVELAPSSPEPRHKLIELYRDLHREEAMVDQMRRLAEIYVNQNDFDNAISCLRELLSARPEDTRARVRYIDLFTQVGDESELMEDYLQLARILARKGSVVEATRTFEKLIEVHADASVCREEFIQFLFSQGQIHRAVEETRGLVAVLEKQEQYQEIGRVLDRALNYAPEELDLRQKLADVYLKTNRRGQAMESYRSLARYYEQNGDQSHLTEVIEQIVNIDSLNVEFRQRLADLLSSQGETQRAMEHFEILADQYMQRQLFDLAEHEYRRILEIQPENLELREKLIETHLMIGSIDECLPDLTILCEIYEREGRLKDAVKNYRRVLQSDPDNIEILKKYIDTYSQIGLEQDLVDDYLHLADLKTKRGDLGKAVEIYRHLTEVTPDHPIVRERLSATQQVMGATPAAGPSSTQTMPNPSGDNSSASDITPEHTSAKVIDKIIRNYENVLRLNPANPTARAKLAEMLEKKGDQGAADEHWMIAAENFLKKNEYDRCLEICERYLNRYPDNERCKGLLSRAQVQRDSMKAIDGALSDL